MLEAAKLIFPEEHVANAIAEQMARTHGIKTLVKRVTQGFQVCRVTVCKPFVPPAVPLPVSKPAPVLEETSGDAVVVSLPFIKESPNEVGAMGPDGKPRWIRKSSIMGWSIDRDTGTIRIKMSPAYAKRRGLA